MYHYIDGKVTDIAPNFISLENNGIGYLLFVPNPFSFQVDDAVIRIYTELIVREDSHLLYGFKDKETKQMFQSLLKVTGIGPKSALAILSSATPNEVIRAIENEDMTFMQKFPGIGKKTASQIILDLKGKLKAQADTNEPANSDNAFIDEAKLAFEALGYSKREVTRIEKHLEKQSLESVDEAVRIGLKYLIQ